MNFASLTLADGEQWIDGEVENQSRLIAQLTKERNEAQEALANASIIEGHLEQRPNIEAQRTIDELTAKISELEEWIYSGDCCAEAFDENDRLKAAKETLTTALRAIGQENLSLIDQLVLNANANANPATPQQPYGQHNNGAYGVQSVSSAEYYGNIHGNESPHTKKLIFLQRCIGSRDYMILQLLDLINAPAPALRKLQQLMAALDANFEYHERKAEEKRASARQQQPSVARGYGVDGYGVDGTPRNNGQLAAQAGYNGDDTPGYIAHSPADGGDDSLSPDPTTANLKKELEAVQTREQMLVLRLKEVEEENSLLKGQKEDANTENEHMQQTVAGDYMTYIDVDAGVRTLEQSVSDLSYTVVEASYERLTRDELLNTVVSMSEDMEARDDTVSWLKDYVISTKDNLFAANNRVQELLQSVHKIVGKDGETQARLKQFESQTKQAGAAFIFRDNERQGFLKNCHARIHKPEENLNEEKHDMLELRELKNDLEAQLSEVVGFAAEIGWEIAQMIEGLEAESRDAKAQLAAREEELSQVKEDLDAHTFDKEKLKKEAHEAIDYQNAEMEKLKVAMEELKVVAADAQKTAQELNAELTALRNSQHRQSSFSSVTMSRLSSQFAADDARSPFKQGYFHERTISRRTSTMSGRGDIVCVKSPDSVRSFIPSPPSGTLKRLSSVRGQRRGSRYAGMMSPEDAQNVSIPLMKRRFPGAKIPHINLCDATFGDFDLPAEPVTPKAQKLALVSLCSGARDLSVFTDSLSPSKDAANTTFVGPEFTPSSPVFSAADGSVRGFANGGTPPLPQRANPAAQKKLVRAVTAQTAGVLPKGYYSQNLPAVTAQNTFRQGPITDGNLHSGPRKALVRIPNNQVQSRSPLILQPRATMEVSGNSLIGQSAESRRSVSESTSGQGLESHKSSPASDTTVRAEPRRAFSSELPLPKTVSGFTSIAMRKTRLGLPGPSGAAATMGRHGREASASSEPASKSTTARRPSVESPDITTSALAQLATSSGPMAELVGGRGGDLSAQPNQEPQDKIPTDTLLSQPVATPTSDRVFTPGGSAIPRGSYRGAPTNPKISRTVFKEGSSETPKSATRNAQPTTHAMSAPKASLLPTLPKIITPAIEPTNGAKSSNAKMDSGDPEFVFPKIPNTKPQRDSVSSSPPIASSTPNRSRQFLSLPASPRLSLFPPAPSDNGASQHQKLMSGLQSKSKTGIIRSEKTVNTQPSLMDRTTQFSFGDGSMPKAIREGQTSVRDVFDEDTLDSPTGPPPPIPRRSSKRTATQPLRGRAPLGQRSLANASEAAGSLHLPTLQPEPATTRLGPARNRVASEPATSELPMSRTIGSAPLEAPARPISAPKNVPETMNKALTVTKARGRKVSELASRFGNMQTQSSSPHSSSGIEGYGSSPNLSMIRLPSGTDSVRKASSQYSMRASSLNNSLRSAASNNSMRNASRLSANMGQGNVSSISSNLPQTQSTLRNISASFEGADDGSMFVQKQRQAAQHLPASGGDGGGDSSSFVGADTGSLFDPKQRQDIGANQSAQNMVEVEIKQKSSEFETADSGSFFTPGKQPLNQGNLRNGSQASAVSWTSELSCDVKFGSPYGPLGIIGNYPEKPTVGSYTQQADDQSSFGHFTVEHSSSPASAIKSPSSGHRFASNPFKGLMRPKAQSRQIPGVNTVEGSPRQGSFARNVAAIFMPGFKASPSRNGSPMSPDQLSTPKSHMDNGKSPATDPNANPMQRLLVPPQVMKTSPTPQRFFTPTENADDEGTPTKAGVILGIRDKDGNLVNQANLKPPQPMRRRRSSTASRTDSGTGASSHPSMKSPKLPHAYHENEPLRDIEGRIISSRFPPPVGYKSPPPRHNFPGLPSPLQDSTNSQLCKDSPQAVIYDHSGNYADLESPREMAITNQIGDNFRRYESPFAPAVPPVPEISGSPTPTDEYEPSFLHASDRGSFDDPYMREAIMKAKIQSKLEARGAAVGYSMIGRASQMFNDDDIVRALDATEVPLPRNMSQFSYLSYMTRTTATGEMDPVRAAKARKEAEDRLNGAGPADDSYNQDKGIAFLEKLFEKSGKDDPALMMLSPKSKQMQQTQEQVQEQEYTASDHGSTSGSGLGAAPAYDRKSKGPAKEYFNGDDSANNDVYKQQDHSTSDYDSRSALRSPSAFDRKGRNPLGPAREYFGRENSANTEVFNLLGADKAREKAKLMGEVHRHIKQEPINRAMAASIEEENIKIRAIEDARFAKMAEDEEERIARIIESETRKAEFDQRQQEYAANMQREAERREEDWRKVEVEETQKDKEKKKGGAFKRLFSR